ncbi:MAG TPA: hypothetical protein PK605_00065 [Ignavibacteria bacterium]|nr:hypothetical protein [Bacteroidota bacterium]HRE12321.1 hypothetical protein [Ignavibacteria bacterium]HRF65930.1 hypothetical protein [Ignavibacteria bacterium]HRJ02772.1 hypothetical protein [Ignavibacteria bacterium]
MSERSDKYFQMLDGWLKYYGFESLNVNEQAGTDRVYKRSRVEVTKFGKVDCYICAKYMPEGATGDELRIYSDKMFSLANRHRTGAPLGFGAMLVVYPLIITENISAELAGYISQYCPKHFAAAEFPSVLDINTGGLYYYPNTPIWGYAYYATYRRESYTFFSPKSWEDVANKQVVK